MIIITFSLLLHPVYSESPQSAPDVPAAVFSRNAYNSLCVSERFRSEPYELRNIRMNQSAPRKQSSHRRTARDQQPPFSSFLFPAKLRTQKKQIQITSLIPTFSYSYALIPCRAQPLKPNYILFILSQTLLHFSRSRATNMPDTSRFTTNPTITHNSQSSVGLHIAIETHSHIALSHIPSVTPGKKPSKRSIAFIPFHLLFRSSSELYTLQVPFL